MARLSSARVARVAASIGPAQALGHAPAPADLASASRQPLGIDRVDEHSAPVGPTGPPKTQLMPTRIRLMPITAMMVPVTTGGKKRSMRLTNGAISIEMTPAPMMAPKIAARAVGAGIARWPSRPSAPTAAKVTPIITGSLMPNHLPTPSDWISVDEAAAEQVGRDQQRHLLAA